MNHLLVLAWRLPPGEPDWHAGAATLDRIARQRLAATLAEWEDLQSPAAVWAASTIARARAKARRGLAELRRAYTGHPMAVTLCCPDGTRVLVTGGESKSWEPFEGWDDLCFAAGLGIPEALGWEPLADAPPAEEEESPASSEARAARQRQPAASTEVYLHRYGYATSTPG